MEKTVTMPKLGMTMEDGEVLNWRYQEGDWVEKGEPLVEVMTDKVNIEVEAPFNGRLVQIIAREGDILPVGAPIAMLNDGKPEEAPAIPPTSTPSKHIRRSEPAQTSPGTPKESREEAQLHIPIASTPAAKREAALQKVDLRAVAQAGATLPLNRADITAFVQSKQNSDLLQESTDTKSPAIGMDDITEPARLAVSATPLAQKIALAHHIDLSAVAERNSIAKVTRADVEAHIAESAQSAQATERTQALTISPAEQDMAESELVPLTSVRRLIGQRMLESITSAPHIYLDTEIDMTEAERCRRHVGHTLKIKGEPVPSITALIIRAAATALLLHPQVNATLEPAALQGKNAIRRWRAVHIGIAVDTEQALLTPVIRNAQKHSFLELAGELRRLALAARQGSLKPDEMAGATFTISNLGMYGIDTFHAIIAPGQSAILAVGKVTKRAAVIEDGGSERIEIRPIMKVSLSADHRVLDGASGSRFLQQFKAFLEDPYLLL